MDTYHPVKFYPNQIRGIVYAHARLRAPNCLHCYFWVLSLTYSQDASTDIDAKYVKRRRSVQAVPFGVVKPKFNIYTRFPKKRHFGPDFDGTYKFLPENNFNIGVSLS